MARSNRHNLLDEILAANPALTADAPADIAADIEASLPLESRAKYPTRKEG